MLKSRYTLAVASAVALSLALAACSTDPTSGSMTGMDHGSSGSTEATSGADIGPHNDADLAFAMSMIPHHQQAVEMADMILAKDGIDADVVSLAERIKAAQDPEISTMTSWLKAWGASMGGSDMAGMSGMMSDEDMAALEQATGNAASRLFLEQMTQHHQGAIAMARREISDGQNPDALALANSIIESQTAELAEMQNLLSSL